MINHKITVSLGNEGWNQLTTVLILAFSTDYNEIKLLLWVNKPLKVIGQVSELKFESKFEQL